MAQQHRERAVKVTLVKSVIGSKKDQRATVKALGLNKTRAVAYHWETPQIRGMINKVSYLLEVEEISPEELEAMIQAAEAADAQAAEAASEEA